MASRGVNEIWKDISDYRETKDLLYITLGVLIVDVFVIFLTRYMPGIFGCALNLWYTDFGISAVLADVGVIVIGFLIARFLYTKFLEKKFDWNPLVFVGLLILVQLIHDIIFYLGVIVPIPRGHNAMMDVFKDYSEGGAKILVGDSVLMVLSAIVAMLLKGQEDYSVGGIGVFVLYAMSYVLYTKPIGGICPVVGK